MKKGTVTKIDEYVVGIVNKKRIEKGFSEKELAIMLNKLIGVRSYGNHPPIRKMYSPYQIFVLSKIFECPMAEFLPEKPFPPEEISNVTEAKKK